MTEAGMTPDAVKTWHHAHDRLIIDPLRPALAMISEPLRLLHGGPLRIVAPGFPGSAWQKRLDRIELWACEHDGKKLGGTNCCLPIAPIDSDEPLDAARFIVITDMLVTPLITTPLEGYTATCAERLAVARFGWSGAIPLAGVRVCSEGGVTWQDAEVKEGEGPSSSGASAPISSSSWWIRCQFSPRLTMQKGRFSRSRSSGIPETTATGEAGKKIPGSATTANPASDPGSHHIQARTAAYDAMSTLSMLAHS